MPNAVLRAQAATPLSQPLHSPVELPISVALPEANDNKVPAAPQQPECRMFELPLAIWGAMIGCYATFLLALLGATGGAKATFAIVISAVYVTMFFGTARVMLRQASPQPRSVLERPGSALQTACGPMSRADVYGQVLIVPGTVAFFGIAISIISAIVR